MRRGDNGCICCAPLGVGEACIMVVFDDYFSDILDFFGRSPHGERGLKSKNVGRSTLTL